MTATPSPISRMLKVIAEPDLYEMVLRIYLPVLFPLTFLIVLASLALDRALGLGEVAPAPTHLVLAGLFFTAGCMVWLGTYATLIYGGDGSPAPVVRRTQKLVNWGIYRLCRNPSVHGKLLGFVAVGLVVNSPSFVYLLTPALLAGSLYEKVWRQEPQLVEVFGEEYEAYRREVPLFIPRISTVASMIGQALRRGRS